METRVETSLPPWMPPAIELVKYDWVSPSIGLVQCIWCGYGLVFKIPFGPMTGYEIVVFLRQQGIKTWAHGIDPWDETICFMVSKEDGSAARRLLVNVL